MAELDHMTCDTFTGHVDDAFELRGEGGVTRHLELAEAQTMGAAPKGDKRHAFSLVFRCDDPEPLPQQIYTVRHDDLGELELFLVPVGPDGDAEMRYEAVFT